MKKFNPGIVRGYASAVYFIARKMLETDVDDIRPRAVITSAESLIPEYRQTIEEAFGCKVFDHYGSREIGAMASECEEHMGFHVSAENVLLEFVRDGEHVAPGEHGVILATNLRNYGMPFIRYELGDVGRPSEDVCTCGRGLPLIESIDGRVSQFVSIYDEETGKVIPVLTSNPGIIAKVLNQVPVVTFRVSQKNLEKITIELVTKPDYSDEHTEFVQEFLYDYIGKYIEIEIKFVESFPPLPSGKRSVVVSDVNPFNL
jgi:phenylacetate-CoA ligase